MSSAERDLLLLSALPARPAHTDELYVAREARNGAAAAVVTAAIGSLPAPGAAYDDATVVRAYRVETVVHWDDGGAPGITRLAFVAPLPGISAERFRERYLEHAPIARVQHPGICRYVQRFVVAGSEPVCAAIAELHFADAQAMQDRFYRDADSPGVVDADISDYLDRERTWSLVARSVPVSL